MNIEQPRQILELVTLGEASRRIGCNGNTLRRAIERHGVRPDALAIGGSNKKTSPLFVEPRLRELKTLVEKYEANFF